MLLQPHPELLSVGTPSSIPFVATVQYTVHCTVLSSIILMLLQYKLVLYSWCCYNLILYFFCRYNLISNTFVTTTSSPLPDVATTSSPIPFLATVRTTSSFLMLLQPHPVLLYAALTSSSTIPYVAITSSYVDTTSKLRLLQHKE